MFNCHLMETEKSLSESGSRQSQDDEKGEEGSGFSSSLLARFI